MLLSPGNSPRHISSEKTLVTAAETTQSSSSNSLPSNSNPRRKSSPEVLDEDAYIAALERIVERDFFPDLPKLRDRLDWLEAVRSGDPVHIEKAVVPRLKSWIRKVVLEKDDSEKTDNPKPTMAEEAAAAVAAADVARASQELLNSKSEDDAAPNTVKWITVHYLKTFTMVSN